MQPPQVFISGQFWVEAPSESVDNLTCASFGQLLAAPLKIFFGGSESVSESPPWLIGGEHADECVCVCKLQLI